MTEDEQAVVRIQAMGAQRAGEVLAAPAGFVPERSRTSVDMALNLIPDSIGKDAAREFLTTLVTALANTAQQALGGAITPEMLQDGRDRAELIAINAIEFQTEDPND